MRHNMLEILKPRNVNVDNDIHAACIIGAIVNCCSGVSKPARPSNNRGM